MLRNSCILCWMYLLFWYRYLWIGIQWIPSRAGYAAVIWEVKCSFVFWCNIFQNLLIFLLLFCRILFRYRICENLLLFWVLLFSQEESNWPGCWMLRTHFRICPTFRFYNFSTALCANTHEHLDICLLFLVLYQAKYWIDDMPIDI